MVDFRFYLITGRRAAGGRDLLDVLGQALGAGVRAVLLREKDLPVRELLALAGRVRELTARHGAKLLVSSRVDVALASGADGVHLSGTSLPVRAARELVGPEKLVAASTHSLDEALDAQEAGADFITFGPVYHTPSKARYGPPVGLDALGAACARLAIPVFALGGVDADNAAGALDAGAHGVAAISAVIGAPEPGGAAARMLEAIARHDK